MSYFTILELFYENNIILEQLSNIPYHSNEMPYSTNKKKKWG